MTGDAAALLGAAMDIVEKREAVRDEAQKAGPSSISCSICLEPVSSDSGGRSVAALQCGHQFHLDCIGSSFNAKGLMKCPNCRKVENGRWLYASGCCSSDPLLDDLSREDMYEMLLRYYWCPVRGFPLISSRSEEGRPMPPAHPHYDALLHGARRAAPPAPAPAAPNAAQALRRHLADWPASAEPHRRGWAVGPGDQAAASAAGGAPRPGSSAHPLPHYQHPPRQHSGLVVDPSSGGAVERQSAPWPRFPAEGAGELPRWGPFRRGGANQGGMLLLDHHRHVHRPPPAQGQGAEGPYADGGVPPVPLFRTPNPFL